MCLKYNMPLCWELFSSGLKCVLELLGADSRTFAACSGARCGSAEGGGAGQGNARGTCAGPVQLCLGSPPTHGPTRLHCAR